MRRLLVRVVIAAVSLGPLSGLARGAPACKPEILHPLTGPEANRLEKLVLKGAEPGAESPSHYFVADINNDGHPEIVAVGYQGSGGYLNLGVYVERDGKLQSLGRPPTPKGFEGDEEAWTSTYTGSAELLVKMCDRTYISLVGTDPGSTDGFLWKEKKTLVACDPDWTAFQISRFKQYYDKRLYDVANGSLKGYLRSCGARLKPEARLAILSDEAVTSLHLRDYDACLTAVREAKETSGFETSKSKKALLFNESACTNPPSDSQPADYHWLLAGKRSPVSPFDPAYEGLLAATVPSIDFGTAQLDRRAKLWLSSGIDVSTRALPSHSQFNLRGMVRDDQMVPEDGSPSIVQKRYVTFWGCLPHSCEERSMIWVDVETGTSVFAANNFSDCFVVGSRTLGPADLPAAFKTALLDWKKNKQTLEHDCTYFVDGRNRVVSVMPMD